LLANERINVIAVNTLTDKTQHLARMTFTAEVPDLNALARVLALLDQIPNVTEVRRKVQ
jgi:GTP pyrophosphokinase